MDEPEDETNHRLRRVRGVSTDSGATMRDRMLTLPSHEFCFRLGLRQARAMSDTAEKLQKSTFSSRETRRNAIGRTTGG